MDVRHCCLSDKTVTKTGKFMGLGFKGTHEEKTQKTNIFVNLLLQMKMTGFN